MPFNFDRSSLEAKLPSAGRHPATIADASVYEGEDATWLKVVFDLDSGHQLEHLVAIDADQSSPYLPRLGEGFSFMESMCHATGADIGTLQDTTDIMKAFIGKTVDIVVGLRTKAGMQRPIVKAVMPQEKKGIDRRGLR